MSSDTVVRHRAKLPDIEFPWPDCPVCGHELDLADTLWRCQACQIDWDAKDGSVAGFVEPSKPACGHVARLYAWDTRTVVCRLHTGHDGFHAGYDTEEDRFTYLTAHWELWDDAERPRRDPA